MISRKRLVIGRWPAAAIVVGLISMVGALDTSQSFGRAFIGGVLFVGVVYVVWRAVRGVYHEARRRVVG